MRKPGRSISNAGHSFLIHWRNENTSYVGEARRVDQVRTQRSTSSSVDPMTKRPGGIATRSRLRIVTSVLSELSCRQRHSSGQKYFFILDPISIQCSMTAVGNKFWNARFMDLERRLRPCESFRIIDAVGHHAQNLTRLDAAEIDVSHIRDKDDIIIL